MQAAVFGAGSWGTTLANLLAKKGVPTTMWAREQQVVADIKATRVNSWYLPEVELDASLEVTNDLAKALDGADFALHVVPTQFFRSLLMDIRPLLPQRPVLVCANKGIEVARLKTISQMVDEELASLKPRFSMLSGPSFAAEVSGGQPTAVVLGCADKKLAADLQETLSTDVFRVYTSPDYRGVELGGAVKNVMAIAAGIADGLGFGTNARAALITRGLSEMARLGKAMGAKAETFHGLSGMGDLVLTCTGDLSRNRQVGLKLGSGMTLVDILAEGRSVAEGVKTTEAVHALAKQYGVEMPITEQVHAVLYKDKDARQAVIDLMSRELKEE